ncbi:nucleotidyltransferase domain-containing protein, partial [Candidatus Woesearchaeota archaeon]|nr:nucleotidyltransferase domain-containing protein [Candidatus Woesearchaeota archaeon]
MQLKSLIDKLTLYPEVRMIYLFGSQATGNARPYSDVDICIKLESKISIKKKADILSHSSEKVQLSLFDSLPLYIQYRVFKEGKVLFVRNKLEVHRL